MSANPGDIVTLKFADTISKLDASYSTTQAALDELTNYLGTLAPFEIFPSFNEPDFEQLALTQGPLPDAPVISFPDLTIPDLDVPIPGFNYSDSPYFSALREALKAKLAAGVTNGGTGLGADVENAIWTRQLDRDQQARRDRLDAISSEWAESGFELPDGALAAQLTTVDVEYLNNRQTASKDIAIKQAELARQQSEVFYKEANQLENTMEGKHTSDQARALEAAKVEPEIVLNTFQAHVAKIKVMGEVYNALAAKANAQAQVFKSQVDGYTATAQVSAEAVKASTQLYGAKVEGAKAASESKWRTDINKIEQIKNYLTLRIEGMKALATLSAQVTAAMATSVSTSASISSSGSVSLSTTTSNTTSHDYREEHYYKEK